MGLVYTAFKADEQGKDSIDEETRMWGTRCWFITLTEAF